MIALEEIKKALEGVTTYPGPWEVGELISGKRGRSDAFELQNATDIFGYIYCGHAPSDEVRPVADFIAAANPVAISELLSTLESLQRENEELRKKADARENELVVMLNSADESRVGQIRRAIIAESEAKVLRDIIRDNWGGRSWKPVSDATATLIRTVLASTGGEHHAE